MTIILFSKGETYIGDNKCGRKFNANEFQKMHISFPNYNTATRNHQIPYPFSCKIVCQIITFPNHMTSIIHHKSPIIQSIIHK